MPLNVSRLSLNREPSNKPTRRLGSGRAIDVAVAVGLFLAAVIIGLRFSSIGFLGWDAYPILAASRLETAGIRDILSQPLAGGLLPMSFYRPALSLGVALEWPLWGLSAGGYVAVNAVLFGLCGLALYGLVTRLGSRRAALAAMLFFVVHPVVPDVVPYLPRRPELLCCLFVLASLLLDHLGCAGRSRVATFGSLLATVLAVGSKETAVVLPILVGGVRYLFIEPVEGRRRARFRLAMVGLTAHLGAVGAVLLLRFQVLGDLGGYPDTDVTQLPKLWLGTLAKTLLGVFLPQHSAKLLAVLGWVVLGLCWGLLAVRRGRASQASGASRLRLVVFGGLWLVALATVYAAAARLSPWYLLIGVCGGAIGFGGLLDAALSASRGRSVGRSPALCAVAGATLLLASFGFGSPLLRSQAAYRLASLDAAIFLDNLEQQILASPADSRIEAGKYPRLVIGPGRRQVPVLVAHSIAGWARIVFPDRRLIFVSWRDPVGPVPAGTTVVVLGRSIHRNLASIESTGAGKVKMTQWSSD